MSVERSSPQVTRQRRRLLAGCAAGGLLLAVIVALRFQPSAPLPLPPITTAGFDPVIAAAIASARAEAERTPRSAAARGRLGMVLLAHEMRSPASECFRQASSLDSHEPRWPYFLALAQLMDNPMAASTNFARAVRLFPEEEPAPRLKLGDCLLNLGELAEAEACYRAVLERVSNSAPARLRLGRVAVARGQSGQAAEFLTGAMHDPTTRKAAHRLLLNVSQRQGRTNESEQLGRALAELPHDLPIPDPYLAEVQQRRTGEAAWLEQSEDWIKTGRAADAAQLLEKTLQTYPQSDRAMFFLGRARLRLGDPAGAEAILVRATELAPGSVEAQIQLGVIQLSRGRPKEAQRAFRAAIQAKPNLPEGWFNLGLSLGNDDRAGSEAAFREAIRLKPSFIEAYLGLAVVLTAQGKAQAARDELRHALSLGPDAAQRQKLLDQLQRLER